MKRIFLLCSLLTAFFLCFADTVEYKQCVPAAGSSISSFDFELEFDIDNALVTAEAAKPGNQFGIGYRGGTLGGKTYAVELYKGNAETGELLGTTNNKNFTGKSDGFEINGNKVKISFDSSLPVLSNQEYTLKISNSFWLYPSGSAVMITSTMQDFGENPLILTFTGASSETKQLFVDNCNVEESAETIKSVEFSLNSAFNIKTGAEILIKEGDDIVGRTSDLKVSLIDNKILIADFNEVPLLLGHTYTIELPANSITHIDDATVGNLIYKANVNGSLTKKIALGSSKVDVDSNGIPTAVTFIYEMPEGTTLNGMRIIGFNDGYLSVENFDSSTNLKEKCSIIENGKGLKWDLSSVSFEPATKYVFSKKGDTVIVWDAKNSNSSTGRLKEYSGEDASVSFTTPSVEDLNITPITIGSVKVGQHDDKSVPEFIEGGTYASIDRLEIQSINYSYDGKSYGTTLNWNDHKGLIYDITDGTRKLLKEVLLGSAQREDYYEYYGVFTLYPQMNFLQGKTYEIVIPEGSIKLSDNKPLYNYATNSEIVFTVKGGTPVEFVVESCSVENNSEVNTVPAAIVWTLNGAYDLKSPDVKAIAEFSGAMVGISNPPITIYKNGFNTYVSVQLANLTTGELRKLQKGANYTVTIPAGSIVYPGDESLSNPKLAVTMVGIDEVAPEAEMVNVNLTVNGLHTSAHQTAKGKAYSFSFNPASEWIVKSVEHDGKELVDDGNGTYMTEPLNKDANITAELKYDGMWAVELESGVWEVPGSDIRIYPESGKIVIEGLTPDKVVNVYSTAGLLINSARADEGHDILKISVPLGQTYIVTVDGVAAKIMM